MIDYESYIPPVSSKHSKLKKYFTFRENNSAIKKGKQYFLGFPGFPLYYLLFAPLWDQLKPYSLKKPFMANYLFWQSSMAFSLSIFFILLSKIPFHQIENGISLDTPLSENWSKFGRNQLMTKGASTWVTLILSPLLHVVIQEQTSASQQNSVFDPIWEEDGEEEPSSL